MCWSTGVSPTPWDVAIKVTYVTCPLFTMYRDLDSSQSESETQSCWFRRCSSSSNKTWIHTNMDIWMKYYGILHDPRISIISYIYIIIYHIYHIYIYIWYYNYISVFSSNILELIQWTCGFPIFFARGRCGSSCHLLAGFGTQLGLVQPQIRTF